MKVCVDKRGNKGSESQIDEFLGLKIKISPKSAYRKIEEVRDFNEQRIQAPRLLNIMGSNSKRNMVLKSIAYFLVYHALS